MITWVSVGLEFYAQSPHVDCAEVLQHECVLQQDLYKISQ